MKDNYVQYTWHIFASILLFMIANIDWGHLHNQDDERRTSTKEKPANANNNTTEPDT